MNHVDSDLEEGEIVDDSPPSPNFNDNKRKELPQRYVVGDNKNSVGHKHRKGCRHSVRYHAKKLSKLKKLSPKMKDKRHKPTCIYEKTHKVSGRCNSADTIKNVHSKNGYFSQNSLIAEMKGSLTNVSPLNKLSTNIVKPKIEKIPIPNQNLKTCENNSATFKTSSAKTHKDRTSKPNNVCLIDLTVTPNSVTNIELKPDSNVQLIDLSDSPCQVSNITEVNSNDGVKNVDTSVSNNLSEVKDEESEDEEELRRIALATCVKRKALVESQNKIQNIDYPCNETAPDAKHDDNVHSCHQVTKNPLNDNYEVVDMEVDEDMPDSLENENAQAQKSEPTENLFVIDTNPSNDFLQNKENSFSKPQTTCDSSEEEFEVNILRAECINSMYRMKLLKENSEKLKVPIPEKQTPVTSPKKSLVNYQAQNLFRNKRLKSAKHFLRKRSVGKLGSMKKNNSIIPLPVVPVEPKKSSERLIIRINGESSDDSDDNSEEEANTVSENPVDSIVALISDCRQKSESNTETKEELVPQAVSYLSKAMQEEYNSYMKILAKKKKLPAAPTLSPKNGLVRTPLDDLKKLEEKLEVLRGALEKKKKSMSALSQEVTSKKHHYMKAKLTAQHLKEQLIAAEKVRKAKLLEWSKTCDSLKSMKKSVSDLENKMNEVQNLCSKFGSSLQGQSYKLPVLLQKQNEQS